MRVLNLYACLGGNRLLWEDCEVTAVELDPVLAKLYQERFPSDKVVNGDAHQYLLDHYDEFDFIWSSPPCPTHSRARFARRDSTTPAYPDMKLYQEIIFLKKWYKGKWVVENVIPYYDPLIHGKKIGRHIYWSNFIIPSSIKGRKHAIMESEDEVKKWCKFHKYDFTQYDGEQRLDKLARNLVDYEVGAEIFNIARGIHKANNSRQTKLF